MNCFLFATNVESVRTTRAVVVVDSSARDLGFALYQA